MQLRHRKNTVSLVRSVYDPSIKRCKTVTLARISADTKHIPANVAVLLTPAELKTVTTFCENNGQKLHQQHVQIAAENLAQTLKEVTHWYLQQKNSAALAKLAYAAREQWSHVLAAMTSAGVGRTRKRRSKDD